MKKQIGTFILQLGGWTEDYPQNFNNDKCVLISAPHTSLKDYMYTVASFWKRGVDVKILFKNNKAISLINCFLIKIIGTKFDEIKKDGINFSVKLLNQSDKLALIIPTECKFKKVEKWKTDFYDIAQKAKVPVALGYLDYYDRVTGVGHMFSVSGNKKIDLVKIQNFYKNFTPRHPKKYNSTIC